MTQREQEIAHAQSRINGLQEKREFFDGEQRKMIDSQLTREEAALTKLKTPSAPVAPEPAPGAAPVLPVAPVTAVAVEHAPEDHAS